LERIEFKPDAARSSLAVVQSLIGMWLKSAPAPTLMGIHQWKSMPETALESPDAP
jgi:hypothetical protein